MISRPQDHTDEELAGTIDYCKFEISEMQYEERNPKWFIRKHGYENVIRICKEELERREHLKHLLDEFGSVSLESEDPTQLKLW